MQKGYPVLPKTTNRARLLQNADIFSFTIDSDDMSTIEKMDRGGGVAWSVGDPIQAA